MTKIITTLQNAARGLFSLESREKKTLARAQNRITHAFAGTEPIRRKFKIAQEALNENREKLAGFRDENSNLDVKATDVANRVAHKRLLTRKWFAVLLNAFLGIGAVTVFFETTLHIRLPWLTAAVIGCVLAYLQLSVAIQFRYDALKSTEMGEHPFLSRGYFILPLLVIPALNGFIILNNPDNPANPLLGFFLVFSLVVDVAVTGYAVQYVLMQETKVARGMIMRLQQENAKAVQAVEDINREMHAVRMFIIDLATEFRTVYEAMVRRGDSPIIVIPLPYVFVLNRRIWYTDVLPIRKIQITEPAGSVAEYSQFWDATTAVDLLGEQLPVGGHAGALAGAKSARATEDSLLTNEADIAPSDSESIRTQPDMPAPEIGASVSENEKYV